MKFMVFDVESVGLHGEGFAVGYVVVDKDTQGELNSGLFACPAKAVKKEGLGNDEESLVWLEENIPGIPTNCTNARDVRNKFWAAWETWKAQVVLVADCAWPVEARFLIDCIRDDPTRKWNGPYPLVDLAGILIARGIDPTKSFDRLPNELPAHNPLNDARQSARILKAHLI